MVDDIKNIVCPNKLNSLFFSDKNIVIIQNGIRKTVFDLSNGDYLIGNQSNRELTIIMRSIYLQYSKNLDDNITQQINNLNNMVIRYSVKCIMSNIKQYISYKKNVDQVPVPMNLPKNMSNRGEKSLNCFQY